MPSLKDFIEALQAGWFVALTILVGSLIIISGDYLGIDYLDRSPGWLITTSVVAGVFSFSVIIANIAYIPVRVWRFFKEKRFSKKLKEETLEMIENAPDQEYAILVYLAKSGRQAFNAEFTDRRLSPLVSKGLIRKLGGTHSSLEWPYMVRQEAWDIMQERKDRIIMEMPPREIDPFHWRN